MSVMAAGGTSERVAREIRVGGRVQGVGFRPFVLRLAASHRLTGWVRNDAGIVSMVVQGDAPALDAFARDLIDQAPPLAKPVVLSARSTASADSDAFRILTSTAGDPSEACMPPDHFACDDCLAEMRDAGQRRYRYPFINCTQCGPRYTIIRRLPYDRPNTTMAGFALCPACAAEYADPLDRRFHAQPLACPVCGPTLSFRAPGEAAAVRGNEPALAACVEALRCGLIVAVKGVGGYHLLCDAGSDAAVARLRERKSRPHKPLAVMVRAVGGDGLDDARRLATLAATEAELLRDPMRPIVLLTKKPGAPLAAAVAPGLGEVGLMLPYSPLHHLLVEAFGGPLVATSGNLSGEPVLTEEGEASARLPGIADAFLHHDRPIERPADDSVYRWIAGHPRPLRLGRGAAPLTMHLPSPLRQPVLAVGGHQKVTVALAWGDRVVVSPHIGDLGSRRGLQVFSQVVADLQALYGVQAAWVAHDAHPAYGSTRWAERCGLALLPVFHHHAHASALAGEHGVADDSLIFTWDGVGYGEDGTLWGGEALYGMRGAWRRIGSLRAFSLPGGERAGREPWRSALGLCWEVGLRWRAETPEHDVLRAAWRRRVNSPRTSAVGRLFDAAAAFIGLVETASFEGHGPMWLEAVSEHGAPPIPLPLLRQDDLWRADWAPLLSMLMDGDLAPARRGGILHASLAHLLLAQAKCVREETGVRRVGLAGGVFQNRILTETAVGLLQEAGFEVLLARQIPVNDACISFGQIIEAGARIDRSGGSGVNG